MISVSSHLYRITFQGFTYSSQVIEQGRLYGLIYEIVPVFRTKDNMCVNFGQRLWHCFSLVADDALSELSHVSCVCRRALPCADADVPSGLFRNSWLFLYELKKGNALQFFFIFG